MKKQKQQNKNHKMRMILPGLLAISLLGIFLMKNFAQQEESLLVQMQEKQGYIRTVEAEEYEFFKKLVDRDLAEDVTEEELDALTRKKVNRVNAEFMLAAQMDLCNPYSFESFQRDMENENNQRKLKKEKGEVFYGPEEFNLITYYNYISGNLKLDMVTFITENADSAVMDGARKYFEENSEKYLSIEKINYLLTEDEKSEELSLKREDMSTLEKTDSTLFEFLYYGEAGDIMEYLHSGRKRSVQLISVEYEELTFKNNMERAVRDYITNVYLENWIQTIEENWPVEFKL